MECSVAGYVSENTTVHAANLDEIIIANCQFNYKKSFVVDSTDVYTKQRCGKYCGCVVLVPVSYTHLDVYKRQNNRVKGT